jgi:hypothetical protein
MEIEDPKTPSVLDLLVERDEPQVTLPATPEMRKFLVEQGLQKLEGMLGDTRWGKYTTGVTFIRLLGEMVRNRQADGKQLRRFINQTFDHKHGRFRPYSISQFLKQEFDLAISHKTVEKMMNLLTDLGPHYGGGGGPDRPPSAGPAPSRPRRKRSSGDDGGEETSLRCCHRSYIPAAPAAAGSLSFMSIARKVLAMANDSKEELLRKLRSTLEEIFDACTARRSSARSSELPRSDVAEAINRPELARRRRLRRRS